MRPIVTNRGKFIRWGIFCCVALMIGGTIVLADRDALPEILYQFYAFPLGDKAGHFLLMGLLAVAVNLVLPNRSVYIYGLPVFLSTLLVLGFVTVEEISQIAFQSRTFSLVDLGFSFLGIGAVEVLMRRRKG